MHNNQSTDAIRSILKRLAGVGVAALVVVALFVSIFAGGLHQPKPHDVPVGIVAPPTVMQHLEAGLTTHAPAALDLHHYASTAQAQQAIEDRTVDGAFVVTPGSWRLLLAGASGDAVTAVIRGTFTSAAKATRLPLVVRDIKPLPRSDPSGLVPFFLGVGLVIPSFLFAVLLFFLAAQTPIWPRLVTVGLFAFLAALVGVTALDAVLGSWNHNFWEVVGTGWLLSFAVISSTAAIQRLFGLPGTGLAGLTLIPLGMVTSGGVLDYHLLPNGFRQLSQLLPPGAAVSAFRNAMYFDGNGLATHLLVLAIWVGVALVILIAVRGGLPDLMQRKRARRQVV